MILRKLVPQMDTRIHNRFLFLLYFSSYQIIYGLGGIEFLNAGDLYTLYWQKRAAFQQSAFGQSTAGSDVVATIFIILVSIPFQPPSAILGPPGSHLKFCRRCGVAGGAAGGEQVPPSPLGCYSFFFNKVEGGREGVRH